VKYFGFSLFFLLFVTNFFTNHNAAAFSTDSQGYQTRGNITANMVDPDEQMPSFIMTPNHSLTENRSPIVQEPSVPGPRFGDKNEGAQAFEWAFSHQQNRN